jgi:malonate decarboxylase delta subunit
VTGFRQIWEAVIEDFFSRASPGGLRFSVNDGGARPETVSLRLMQSVRLMESES